MVVDASVGIRWFMRAPGDDAAVALLQQDESLIAPDLILPEACNAAWRAVRAGMMTAPQADAVADQLPLALQSIYASAGLARRAGDIARSLDHPVYDCFYLALAERSACDMVTTDQRLLRRVAKTAWRGRVHALVGISR